MTLNDSIQALHAAIGELFLHGGSQTDRQQMARYANARPQMASVRPLLPADEADERLEFANSLLAHIREESEADAEMTAMTLALVAIAPLDQLRRVLSQGYSVLGITSNTTQVVRIFMQRSNTGTNAPGGHPVQRRQPEATLCLKRDNNRCILTGKANPQACHIFPFAGNNSSYRLECLRATWAALSVLTNGNGAFLTRAVACTDHAYNMISLTPTLHDWWARGYIAFRCLGVTPMLDDGSNGGRVDLQLQWLPRHSARPSQHMQPNAAAGIWEATIHQSHYRDCINDWCTRPRYGDVSGITTEPIIAVADPATGRLLQTGQVFSVTLPSLDDATKMKVMIDLQWACLQLASMSGAAGDATFPDSDPDEEAIAAEERRAFWRGMGVYDENEFSVD